MKIRIWGHKADRGFSQALKKQQRLGRRLKARRMAIPNRGEKPHPDQRDCWFQKALKQRVKIEPVIGDLKNDHRMSRCRSKGKSGDTANVVWAVLAWNTKKIACLHKKREEKQLLDRVRAAAWRKISLQYSPNPYPSIFKEQVQQNKLFFRTN